MQVVLITGAAGGLGQELAREFAEQQWHVAAGFHVAKLSIDAKQIWPVALDVTDSAQTEEVVRQILARWGRIDLLVNNAGITSDQACSRMNDSSWDRVLDVNLKGVFLCSRAVLEPMLKQGAGQIINVASQSGRVGQRGQANYAAAKAGLFGLTASLAREVGSRNIRVNSVLPGVLPSGMTARLDPAVLSGFARANVLGRINSLGEVARFVAFLAGLENVSGQLFQLDSRINAWT